MRNKEKEIWERLGEKALVVKYKLVWTVLSYGVEIWGWKEREGMERLEDRYLRWTLGVDRRDQRRYADRKSVV